MGEKDTRINDDEHIDHMKELDALNMHNKTLKREIDTHIGQYVEIETHSQFFIDWRFLAEVAN